MSETAWLPAKILRALVEATSDAIVVTEAGNIDLPGPRIVYVNPAFTLVSGYTADEVIGRSPRLLQGPGTDRAALARIRAALVAGRQCREEILNYTRDGRPYWLDVNMVPLFDEDGTLRYFAAIERDVTGQRRRADQLEILANQDTLTGIGNRAALMTHLAALLAPGARVGRGNSLLLLDLDHFKQVNDTHGHQAGDDLLRRFTAMIVAMLRRDDVVARLGGDEFAVILADGSAADTARVARRIILETGKLKLPSRLTAGVGVSIGIARITPGDTMETLIAAADEALYEAKRAGRNGYRLAASLTATDPPTCGPAVKRGDKR